MTDEVKTREQLLEELEATRRRVVKLESQLASAGGEQDALSGAINGEYGRLLDAVQASLVVHDSTGRIVHCNSTAVQLLGLHGNTILGVQTDERSWTFLREDGTALPLDEYPVTKVQATRRPLQDMLLGVIPPGHAKPRWLLVGAVPLFVGEDRRPWVVVTSKDNTERKQANERARLANERIHYLLSAATAVVYSARPSGDFAATFISENVKRITGYEVRDFVENPRFWFDHIHPGDVQNVHDEMPKLFDKNLHAYEYRFRVRDGTYIWVRDEMKLVLDGQGNPAEIIGFWSDISQYRRDEQRRLSLEAQLLQSQKIEAIGRLAGGVAHDFNNMLAGIMGYASLVQMKLEPGDPRAKDTGEILTICKRARDLTGDLLGFARKGKFRKERINLNESVRNVRKLLKRTISKKIRIEIQLAEVLSRLEGDPSQIEQVLMNLCINSADAMNDGGQLTISTREFFLDEVGRSGAWDLEPGRYVELLVSDDGTGMAPEILKSAFEPFFTTKPQGEGTGLGLSMVYGTIKNHGGSISLESEPGQGTMVLILLPALEPADGDEAQASDQQPVAARSGQGTILLVDDEEIVRNTTARLLESMGYQVVMAGDGEEAVKIYQEEQDEIALVLLDVAMPGMDGPETFHKLREINPAVRGLLFSGYSADAAANQLVDEGAVGFIQKPFMADQLADAVAKALDT
jgi:PAS domain S-box-containing protein